MLPTSFPLSKRGPSPHSDTSLPKLSVYRILPQDAATRTDRLASDRTTRLTVTETKIHKANIPKEHSIHTFSILSVSHYSAIHFAIAPTSSSFSSGVWVAMRKKRSSSPSKLEASRIRIPSSRARYSFRAAAFPKRRHTSIK